MALYSSPSLAETLKRLIRSQMVLRGVDYKQLSQLLADIGIEQSSGTLRTKVSTGTLGAQLLVAIMIALDVKTLDMEQVGDVWKDLDKQGEQ